MEGKALKEIESTIAACTSLGELEKQRVALFGKKGHFAAQFEELKKLDGEEKKAFANYFGTKVDVKVAGNGKGKITIPFHSEEDFNRILKLINS
mgnify:FL=1